MAKDWGGGDMDLDIKKAFDSVSQTSMASLIADKVAGIKPGGQVDPTGQPWEARLWTALLQAISVSTSQRGD